MKKPIYVGFAIKSYKNICLTKINSDKQKKNRHNLFSPEAKAGLTILKVKLIPSFIELGN
jgi:hypothetical protein